MITEKKCKCCGIEKPLNMFHTNKLIKDGHFNQCKDCRSEIRRKAYLANRDRELEKNRAWKVSNKQRMSETNKIWKQVNKEYYAAQQKDYRSTRLDMISEYARNWYIENRDRKLHLGRLWYQNNKEYVDTRNRQWRKDNPDKVRHLARLYRMVNADKCRSFTAKYRASKLQATPLWLDDGHIQEVLDFYTAATMFQVYTGIDYQVDHIVPLQGETVCGLHVPWNLQLLSSFENQSKGNRYWPDMPD